jgi:PncC family amidohydrolase
MQRLRDAAEALANELKSRKATVAVAESSTGGLISVALLSVAGASAYYQGGGVIYTPRARHRLLGLGRDDVRGLKSASEPYALLLANRVKSLFSADWGLSETGATGPNGNPYGDAAGHCCFAVAGTTTVAATLETHSSDRFENMILFSLAALHLLHTHIVQTS